LTTDDPLVSAVATVDDADSTPSDAAERPTLARELTESQQSRLRSESFKSGGETEYKKQAARIEQLEKDNERLEKELEERLSRLQSAEAQVEELREGQSEVAELRTKVSKSEEGSKEAERLVRVLCGGTEHRNSVANKAFSTEVRAGVTTTTECTTTSRK